MPRRRLGKKLFKTLLPILLVLAVALVLTLASIVYGITRPPRRPYLVTPQSFSEISGSALKVTDETWRNRDGTTARGWLLRGAPGPAIVFQHKYGADRSWLFNLGIKLNEATNFTILWPDLRAHGMNPLVPSTTFGTREGDDLIAAIDFLASLKSDGGTQLVGNRVGVYGVELGAYAAALAAKKDQRIQVLVLDSVPGSADDIVKAIVQEDFGLNYKPLLWLTGRAVRVYSVGRYENMTSCELVSGLNTQRILLLAGANKSALRNSTLALERCFPNRTNLEVKTDLRLTGLTLPSATGEQGEAYDRPVIEFFTTNLN